MERISVVDSKKNIPIHPRQTYQKMFISAVEVFSRNLEWVAKFFLEPDERPVRKETYGFRSIRAAPSAKELKSFKDDLINLAKNIEFTAHENEFQNKLKEQVKNLKNDKVLVDADKTFNMYEMDPERYIELVDTNVQKNYKKANPNVIDATTKSHQNIVKNLEIDDRVFKSTSRPAFIKLKDHKQGFQNNPQVRLLNPTKPELGRIAKKILENIVVEVKTKLKLTQWKNSEEVIDWFKAIENKKNKKFIQFDIDNYYASVTPELWDKTLDWAQSKVDITQQQRKILTESKKNFLFHRNTLWAKKGENNFDVCMGAWDGAESTDLVGLYLLSQLEEIENFSPGLYRDDGSGEYQGTPRQGEKLKQKIVEVFNKNGLKVTITANLKRMEFLDVLLDLEDGTFRPYIKPGDKPVYVSSLSNHPPAVLKNLPVGINKRLSRLSATKEIFDQTAPLYQAELDRNGYNHKLQFEPPETIKKKRTRRKRNRIVWFNPPFSLDVRTNVGKKFLRLIDKHFPPGNILHPVFNRRTLKLSYRCLPNIGFEIARNNSKVLRKSIGGEDVVAPRCSCREKQKCPLPGKCTTSSVLYHATVAGGPKEETYVGITKNTFKQRWSGHKGDFEHLSRRNATTLSGYIWECKDAGVEPDITWKILKHANHFSPVTNRCNLCIEEKYQILFKNHTCTLNKRKEIFSNCRHKESRLLVKHRRKRKFGS